MGGCTDRWTDIEGSTRGPGGPKNSEEKEENIWRRKTILFGGVEKPRRRKIFGKENIFFYGGEETLPNKCTTDPDGGLSSSCLSNL